nr:hypothetical protein [Tanacetum cinerariifolium]
EGEKVKETVTWADLEVAGDGPYTQSAGGPKQWVVVVYVVPVGPMFLGRMQCSRHVRLKLRAGRTWTWYGQPLGLAIW